MRTIRARLENLFLAITFAEAGEVDEALKILGESRQQEPLSAGPTEGRSVRFPAEKSSVHSLVRSGKERRLECK